MQRALYSLLWRLGWPVLALRQRWRGGRGPGPRDSLRSRLALQLPQRSDRPLWLHAASVGEVQALVPLVERLGEEFPELPLLVTVGTATGLERARQRLAGLLGGRNRVAPTLLAAPWDLPGAARRFIDAVQPRMGIFIETELWPNLIDQAACARVPLLLVSARVSARSTARYRRWAPSLMRDTVRAFARIGTQSAADRTRFIELGAQPDAVECWGNLKFDVEPPPGTAESGSVLRARLAPDRALWVAGSTHAQEEEACLDVQAALASEARARGAPAPLLVIAPRRPERFEEAARLILARGFALARHSAMGDAAGAAAAAPEVVLLDRLGELLPYYAAADAAFVGGSLVPVGGHNLLEPAALGRPVMAGPHTGNAPEVAGALESAGGLRRVTDAQQLARALRELLEDPARARRQGEAAAAVVAANRGATTRAMQAISAGLAQPAGPGEFPPAR